MTVLLVSGSLAFAQKFIDEYAPKMPKIEPMPAKEFLDKTMGVDEVPGGDVALSYKFRLPKEWKKPDDTALINYQVSNKVLGELVRYYSPPMIDTRSFFSVQSLKLDYRVSAKEWLLQYLLSNGYTIQGLKEFDDNRAEALFVKIDKSQTYVIRSIAQINGKRILLAQYFVPGEHWDEEKQMQAQSIATFEITHPVSEMVEEMDKYRFLDISEFSYPKSWEFKAAPLKNADRMNFSLLNVASQQTMNWKHYKTLNGRIQVDILSYDTAGTVEEEVKKLKEDLSKYDLIAGELIETRKDMKFNKDVEPAPTQVFNAINTQNDVLKYEYWITPLEVEDFYYIITLITPARDEDFFTWSRNWQTYKLILELFRPLEEGLIYR